MCQKLYLYGNAHIAGVAAFQQPNLASGFVSSQSASLVQMMSRFVHVHPTMVLLRKQQGYTSKYDAKYDSCTLYLPHKLCVLSNFTELNSFPHLPRCLIIFLVTSYDNNSTSIVKLDHNFMHLSYHSVVEISELSYWFLFIAIAVKTVTYYWNTSVNNCT